MYTTGQSKRHAKGIMAATAIGLMGFGASGALAQDSADIPTGYETLPEEYAAADTVADGKSVETVTRTRWIRKRMEGEDSPKIAHEDGYYQHAHPTYPMAHAAYPVTLDRETWLAECHARTQGVERDKKGGIIGGLLGAITGGLIGNRAWDSERLAGTVIGAGVGGIAGAVIGNALEGDGRDDYRYDCEAALDRYLSGASYPMHHRVASRSIPAYGYAPMAYAPVYAASYAYQQPMTMIEIREEIPQRVIVREEVREEWVDVPAPQRERVIEEREYVPPPQGKITPIKPAPRKVQQIKGN